MLDGTVLISHSSISGIYIHVLSYIYSRVFIAEKNVCFIIKLGILFNLNENSLSEKRNNSGHACVQYLKLFFRTWLKYVSDRNIIFNNIIQIIITFLTRLSRKSRLTSATCSTIWGFTNSIGTMKFAARSWILSLNAGKNNWLLYAINMEPHYIAFCIRCNYTLNVFNW